MFYKSILLVICLLGVSLKSSFAETVLLGGIYPGDIDGGSAKAILFDRSPIDPRFIRYLFCDFKFQGKTIVPIDVALLKRKTETKTGKVYYVDEPSGIQCDPYLGDEYLMHDPMSMSLLYKGDEEMVKALLAINVAIAIIPAAGVGTLGLRAALFLYGSRKAAILVTKGGLVYAAYQVGEATHLKLICEANECNHEVPTTDPLLPPLTLSEFISTDFWNRGSNYTSLPILTGTDPEAFAEGHFDLSNLDIFSIAKKMKYFISSNRYQAQKRLTSLVRPGIEKVIFRGCYGTLKGVNGNCRSPYPHTWMRYVGSDHYSGSYAEAKGVAWAAYSKKDGYLSYDNPNFSIADKRQSTIEVISYVPKIIALQGKSKLNTEEKVNYYRERMDAQCIAIEQEISKNRKKGTSMEKLWQQAEAKYDIDCPRDNSGARIPYVNPSKISKPKAYARR